MEAHHTTCNVLGAALCNHFAVQVCLVKHEYHSSVEANRRPELRVRV
jgi:hypothetical protein